MQNRGTFIKRNAGWFRIQTSLSVQDFHCSFYVFIRNLNSNAPYCELRT